MKWCTCLKVGARKHVACFINWLKSNIPLLDDVKKNKPLTYQASKFIRQTFVQCLESAAHAELGLTSPVKSDYFTVFLTAGCHGRSFHQQTVRRSCCHSFQMSAWIAVFQSCPHPHSLPTSYLLNYPPYLGTARCWQRPRYTRRASHGHLLPFLSVKVILKSCCGKNLLHLFRTFCLSFFYPDINSNNLKLICSIDTWKTIDFEDKPGLV